MTIKNREFQVNKLNDTGLKKCEEMAYLFDVFLYQLEQLLISSKIEDGVTYIDITDPRYMAIVKTKLEEACFFAKKAIALKLNNQIKEENENE